MSRLLALALLAGGALVAAPVAAPTPAAAAVPGGTLVYIKDHNVWIAAGDGSGQRALTRDGTATLPYGSPTQSDGGVVVATQGPLLVRMDQQGRVLNKMDPPSLPTSVGSNVDGNITSAAISPDGQRIAYSITNYVSPFGYRSATGYTAADHLTDPAALGTTFFWDPSWIGNGRTLQSGGYHSQTQLHDLGQESQYWFDDEDVYGEGSTDLGNAELSPDGRLLAAVRGFDDNRWIIWYDVSGNAVSGPPPAVPSPLCQIGPTVIDHPTWAPDSDALAWQEGDGVWTRSGAHDCGVPSTLLLPGGSEPDWSPAPLSAPAQDGQQIGNGTGTGEPRIKGKARVGKVLRADVSGLAATGKVTVTWLRDGKKVGKGRKHKVVAADRGHRLRIRVVVKAPGKPAVKVTSKSVRVRR